jgi:electron transport complex protein RnfG
MTLGALAVKNNGGDIDAITASTITSRAFLNAINKAYSAYSGSKADSYSSATTDSNDKNDN